jgi:CRISPR-associated protein Csx17
MQLMKLRAVRCRGIGRDNLGGYLAGLGLLAVAAEKWPNVRGCWRDGSFVLLAPDLDETRIENLLFSWEPRVYKRWWTAYQKADTKAKSDRSVWLGRNSATEDEVRLLDSHIVGAGRNYFNPVLGTGGNIGKRDLARVYDESRNQVNKAKNTEARDWLRMTLFGELTAAPEIRGAGTWFVFANKTFNSGQDWYSEGQISPWSFLLAMEGARLLAGGASRRFSSARRYAVFPFVSTSAAAESRQDVKGGKAEFWAPLWNEPATIQSVRALFARGQARIQYRAAAGAFEFALAARAAGLDAGVTEFVRFDLRQTTSAQTYEAVPRERIVVDGTSDPGIEAIAKLAGWVNRLPRDMPNDDRFYGIRGPIERSLIQLAANPEVAGYWRSLLLALADAQEQIDRNRVLREQCLAIPLLDEVVFKKAWSEETATAEIEIARAIASIGPCNSEDKDKQQDLLQRNIFGVDKPGRPFPKQRPVRAVWSGGAPLRSVAEVLERRLIDAPRIDSMLPLCAEILCPDACVHHFVDGAVDDSEIGRWIRALSLIEWKRSGSVIGGERSAARSGAANVHALFRPLFHPKDLFASPGAADRLRVNAARQVLKLIRQNSWEQAVAIARRQYLMRGIAIVEPAAVECDGERIAAALLIPMRACEARDNFNKVWRQPERNRK